jgi:cysteinyl-tRNA synthetase
MAQATQGYARIKKLVSILADKLRGQPTSGFVPGKYASERPEAERVPRMRHHYQHGQFGAQTEAFLARFIEAMDDDLNTPNAVAALFDYVSALYAAQIEQATDGPSLLAVYRTLVRHLAVFGVEVAEASLYPELISEFAQVPEEVSAAGRGGDTVIDRLLTMRREARANKDFAKADVIRNLLTEAGVALEDTPAGPRWTAGK